MTAAETCVRKDGVIIMVAGCCDGHGGEALQLDDLGKVAGGNNAENPGSSSGANNG